MRSPIRGSPSKKPPQLLKTIGPMSSWGLLASSARLLAATRAASLSAVLPPAAAHAAPALSPSVAEAVRASVE